MGFTRGQRLLTALVLLLGQSLFAAETFTVATWNVENYLDAPSGTRPAKPAESKAKVRETLMVLNADVLALQEMGGTNALLELRASLRADGLDYPHWEHVSGFDTNIHVAVLSKFPFIARRPHTNEAFLLNGRRFFVSRGFAEVDVQVTPAYRFTLITAHLKSKRPVAVADESDLREQEALRLREIIDARLKANPNANLVVLGDFNDVQDSRSTKAIHGKSRAALVDTRPTERNGDTATGAKAGYSPRNVAWTYFYGKEDTYSRIDYLLLSRGMAREWETSGTFVLAVPNWGVASDHRPLIATFLAEDK
jgi:endonuclease/exonuclease/phosphatase family metal-dependent hydrolase